LRMVEQREETAGLELQGILRVLRRRRAVILICFLGATAAALGLSLSQTKQYSATAALLFRDPQFDQALFGSNFFAPTFDQSREAATNLRLVSLGTVSQRTARRLGLPGVAVGVSAAGQSNVVGITATNPNPRLAATIADTFADEYVRFRRNADRSKITDARRLVELQLKRLSPTERNAPRARLLEDRAEQMRILASLQTGNAEVVQHASVPASPSSPRPKRSAIFGGLLGLILGVGLAFLFERLDRRLRDPNEIGDTFERPVLGAVPESPELAKTKPGFQTLGSGEAEAFRMLRANLRYFNVDRDIKSVLITSSLPGDGKSTVAMYLAAAAADAGSRVLLLEADLRHPAIATRLEMRGRKGLSQLLAGEAGTLREVAITVPVSQRGREYQSGKTLDVVVSGPLPPNPTDLIESERMREVIRSAEREYDLVVVDTPPTSVVSDAIPLVKEVSGVIVVGRLGSTTRDSAGHLHRQLQNLNAHTLGVVVNAVGRDRGGYGYGYGYGYGAYGENTNGQRASAVGSLSTLFSSLRRSRSGGLRALLGRARRARPGRQERAPEPSFQPQANGERESAIEARPQWPTGESQQTSVATEPPSREPSLALRAVDRAKLQRALDLFNRSEHAGEIVEITRSIAPPKASIRVWDSASAEVLLTVAWQGCWYQFVIDLSNTEDAVRLWSSGEELEKLPAKFRHWNVEAGPGGGLVLTSTTRKAAQTS
jgi:polysaccharide biosynthesis transport protein